MMNAILRNRALPLLASVALVAAVSACNTDSSAEVTNNVLNARLVMPESLLSARVPDNPTPEVLLNGNSIVPMREGDSAQWNASISVEQNRQYQLEVRWKDSSSLIFAEAAECFSTADATPIALNFSADDFDTSRDGDGDGRSNLDELNSETSPRDENDPPERLAESVLTLSVALPNALKDIPDATLSSFRLRVLVNGLPIPNLSENINSDGFLGQANVSVGGRAFVVVEWSYGLPDGSFVRVARLAQPQQINQSGDTFFLANEDGYRLDYDRDSDGTANLTEVIGGTDPISGAAIVCTR